MKHGLHDHVNYKRWMNMIQRCYCITNSRYQTHGAVGIQVCQNWHHDNPEGLQNFVAWFATREADYLKENPTHVGKEIIVCRIDQKQHFTPDNCELVLNGAQQSRRAGTVLTEKIVIAMRAYRRLNPDVMLTFICDLFDVSLANGSRAIRGLTWKTVDPIEPPIKKHFTKDIPPVIKKRRNVRCPLINLSHS